MTAITPKRAAPSEDTSATLPKEKKARVTPAPETPYALLNGTLLNGWSFEKIRHVFAMLPHQTQLTLASICKAFHVASTAQRWTVHMRDVVDHLATYVAQRAKIATLITDCKEQTKYDLESFPIGELISGPQRLYLATQLQPRKLIINAVEPYGLEAYLQNRRSAPHLFSAATKAVQIDMRIWDASLGLNQTYFDLLWQATLGDLELLSLCFYTGNREEALSEEELQGIDALTEKVANAKTRLNLHFFQDAHYAKAFREATDHPNLSIFIWVRDPATGKWNYTRYCQDTKETVANLEEFSDPDFEGFKDVFHKG